MKGFVNPKYIASMEYSHGEEELSKEIPFSKIILFIPKIKTKDIKLGDVLTTIVRSEHKIISFKVIEMAYLNSRPPYLRFNGNDFRKFIKIKGELKPWKKKQRKQSII